jgi:molybdopterin molybdotransferase
MGTENASGVNTPSFEEARQIILESVVPLSAETVALPDSLGRVLAQEVRAPWPLPRFSNSAMDGYAVRAEDCSEGRWLQVLEFVPAGQLPTRRVEKGTAIKIMTGAMVPEGCDSVVPVEVAEERDGQVRFSAAIKRRQHIRLKGEDVAEGETVLDAGRMVRPYEINMLANLGQSRVTVVRKPRVAIVSTGDELVELGTVPGAGQIINSNAYSLAAAVHELGAEAILLGIARDTQESHREKFAAGLGYDALITSAGISMGDRDLVSEVLKSLGVRMLFHRVKVRPGKAMAFGVREGCPVFALPGNPVSSMLTFEEFVAPALRRMMGERECVRRLFTAELQAPIHKAGGYTVLMRIRLESVDGRYLAFSAGKQETGLVRTMVEANAVAVLPPEREEFVAGEEVTVHLL